MNSSVTIVDDKAKVTEETDSPLKGIRCGAVVRPEPLFHRRTRLIIDTHYNNEHNLLRNGLEQTEFDHINLISLDKLFDNKREIFLGFGLPNVYLTIPNEQFDAYIKFAAFMFWRQLSAVVNTKGRVQSGFLIRFRDTPEDMLTAIRQSMQQHSNQRHISCAYANASVLTASGMTSGGSDLRSNIGARSLFQQIYEKGLELNGEPIKFDIIRTTPLTLEEHFHEVRKKEFTSIGRTFKKIYNECVHSDDKNRAPLIEVHDSPTNPIIESNKDYLTRLEISRPARLGAIIRKIWGSHTLFKVIPNQEKIDINIYLPESLRAFPSKNPDLFTRLKKYLLFSRPVVLTIRKQMASLWDDHGEFSSSSIASMMSINTKADAHVYNIVITGHHLIGMHSNPFLSSKVVNWILSKHVLISGYDDDVRFAGEAWMEHQADGVIFHITNNSGTYKPNREHLAKTAQFLSDVIPGLHVQTHAAEDLPATSSEKKKKEGTLFSMKNLLILIIAILIGLYFTRF
ncbi:unnamed protein product [Adineta ricciae]|uniref:Uncharacterized protein n=1 Tax=Adineta ricciae TaxID=249248 RepID=A0A814FZF4_ADIRI|nr:unnamed protein product [Adineta ricciae]CAF1021182.1 unnamed protein product [Adineta ricciae]